MDFTYDDEQDALREAVRGLVGKAYSDYEKRRQTVASDPGFSEDLWKQLGEMGILGLPFAEADGGSGAGPIEVGIVAQELARPVQRPLSRRIGESACRIGVDFQEERIDARGGRRAGHRRNRLADSRRARARPSRTLRGVSRIETNWHPVGPHNFKPRHVDDQRVISK